LGLAVFGVGLLPRHVEGRDAVVARDPNAVCASCHREIYERYRKTPMANASGLAADGFIAGEFTHPASGVHYRIAEDGGRIWLDYRRGGPVDRVLNGRVELRYFVGSGKRGRTYLFEKQGYWFEAPINWYGKNRIWDMAPNFQSAKTMPLNLPVDPGCLHCHASEVAHSLPQARNFYAGEPFAHGGITCEACHGDGSVHVASGGKAQMLKINALPPVKRDSVCLNCHLEGETAVVREGRRLEDFAPGENLFEFAQYFVHKRRTGAAGLATSQWEALMESECKKESGDRLTCTTCHDPHGSPAATERVAYYRQKCLQCHNRSGFAEKHHPENTDCTACHMARPPSNDIAHEQVTDHWIRKRISNDREPPVSGGELEAIAEPGTSANEMRVNDRDLGIAYAEMATRGNAAAGKRALELLKDAEHAEHGTREDHDLHANLGFLEQMDGQSSAAAEEFSMALKADAYDALAAGDLGVLEAGQHQYAEAIGLWNKVLDDDPAQSGVGFDLAIVECGLGDRRAADEALRRTVEFSPDDEQAKDFFEQIESGRRKCGSQ
jgi:predicted CXXCH cytochrome family protein